MEWFDALYDPSDLYHLVCRLQPQLQRGTYGLRTMRTTRFEVLPDNLTHFNATSQYKIPKLLWKCSPDTENGNMHFFLYSLIKGQERLGMKIDRAFIVEPRKHPAFEMTVDDICKNLKLPITIFHGETNKEFAHDIASKVECVDQIKQVNANNMDARSYSKLLITPEFWDHVQGEKALLFQTDSGVCGNGKQLSDFEQFDYCGAPWNHHDHPGGNGGFSIRNVSLAKKHIAAYPSQGAETNEDLLFSEWCHKDPECNLCSKEKGKEFSTETIAHSSFAFHNNWRYGGTPVCEFNATVMNANRLPVPYPGEKPDWKEWQVAISDSKR